MIENKDNLTIKPAIRLGVLFGIIMVLEFMIFYVMDIDPITNPTVGAVMNFCNYLIFPVALISHVLNDYKKTKAVMIQKSPDMTSEQLEMAMTWTKKFMNPMIVVPVTILMFSFLGLIYSLIIGAIVKKDKPQSFN